jgi:putative CocE/NonD family hydrolase
MRTCLGWLAHAAHAATGASAAGAAVARDRLERALADGVEPWLERLPLRSCPPLEGVPLARWYFDHLGHPDDGAFWEATRLATRYGEVDAPMLHVGGWFDFFLDGTLRAFQGLQAHARSAAARRAQRLVVGPWIHGPAAAAERVAGEVDFGPDAVVDLTALRLRWYDHWLKGIDTGVMDGAPVRAFLMGANRWLDLESWPPAGVAYRPLFLRQGTGPAARPAAALNGGALSFAAPDAAEAPDRFDYDPRDPVPSLRRYPELGPVDQRPIEGRVLTYTSDVLDGDLAVVGPVAAVLHAASSARDTDWVVRLCDVWPDGRSLPVCDGILRARYRDSLEQLALLTPGEVHEFRVDLSSTAQVFEAGHRLRVQVTSSDFPRYDRNLNTGGPFAGESHSDVATNTVFHDAARPSHVVLPILPKNAIPPGR